MGAWRLAKNHALVKKLAKVETLGHVNVLCVDKTGTLTKNKMEVVDSYLEDSETVEIMGLCCMEETYDPMEKAMLKYCKENSISKEHLFSGDKIKEYPFDNETKIMGTLWHHEDMTLLASKGSPESILKICDLNNKQLKTINNKIEEMSRRGLRVIGVCKKILNNDKEIKDKLTEYKMDFCGLIGLMDPPRDNINE